MDKTLRNLGVGALAFIAYRGYKLYELANSIDFEFYGMKFQKPASVQKGLDRYQLVLIIKFKNPTKTSLAMRGVEGDITEGTDIIAKFKTGAFEIKADDSYMNIIVDLEPKYVATNIVPYLLAKQSPIFKIRTAIIFPFGFKLNTTFDVKVSDYIPKEYASTFFK